MRGVIKLAPITKPYVNQMICLPSDNMELFSTTITKLEGDRFEAKVSRNHYLTLTEGSLSFLQDNAKVIVIEYMGKDDKMYFVKLQYPDWSYVLDNNLFGCSVEYGMDSKKIGQYTNRIAVIIRDEIKRETDLIEQIASSAVNELKPGYTAKQMSEFITKVRKSGFKVTKNDI